MAWRVAESLEVLRRQFNSRYPNRSKVSDGGIGDAAHASRSSDHNPWYQKGGMGIVTARDFTHDPAVGMDIDRLTDELAASRDPRIKYIIANGYILDSRPGNNPWKWMKYSGSNPHTKHFHLSVNTHNCDDARPWNLPSFGGAAPAPAPAPAPIYNPGGIESMGFNDKYRDWAGNEQTVLAWMDRVDRRVNVDVPNMLEEVKSELGKAVFELTYRHPSRVPGSEGHTDTMLGYSVNADAYGYVGLKMLEELQDKVENLETGGVDVDELANKVAQILAPGIAKAVSDEIAKRMGQ